MSQITRQHDDLVRDVVAEFIADEVAGRPPTYVEPAPEMYVQAEELVAKLHQHGIEFSVR